MTIHHLAPMPQRGLRLSVLASIPVGLIVGLAATEAARAWRWTLSTSPLDPGPPAAVFLITLVSSVMLFSGLALLVMRNTLSGAWLFVLGVALTCGMAAGLFA